MNMIWNMVLVIVGWNLMRIIYGDPFEANDIIAPSIIGFLITLMLLMFSGGTHI